MGAGYVQAWHITLINLSEARSCEGATGKMYDFFLSGVNAENADVEVPGAMLALYGN